MTEVRKRLPAVNPRYRAPQIQRTEQQRKLSSTESRKSVVDVIKETLKKWPTPLDVLNTVPGFSDATVAPQIAAKIFWAVFTVFALIMTAFQLYELVRDYTATPTGTNLEVMQSDDSPVPPITICPLNPYNSSFLKENNLTRDYARLILASQLSSAIPDSIYTLMEADSKRQLRAYDEYLRYSKKTNKTLEQQIFDLGYDCKAFFVQCKLEDEEFDCCSYITSVRTGFGKCFLVTGPKKSRPTVGPFGALELIMNLHIDLIYAEQDSLNLQDLSITAQTKSLLPVGAGVSYADKVQPGFTENAAFLLPGTITYSSFEETRFEDAYGDKCARGRTLKLYKTYTSHDCEMECFYNVTKKFCGCPASSAAVDFGNESFCDPLTSLQCIAPKFLNDTSKKSANASKKKVPTFNDEYNACRQTCTSRCNYISYLPKISYATMASDFRNYSKEGLSKLISFNLERSYTLSKEVQVLTWSSMIGQIGGILGLWLGIQIASIVQIAFYGMATLTFAKQKEKM